MKIKTLLPVGFLAVLFTSCGPTQQKENKADSATTTDTNTKTMPVDTTTDIDTTALQLSRNFLQQTFKDDIEKGLIDSTSSRFSFAGYDLNNDGKNELFAGLTGPYFCGSGGCTWFLLDNTGTLITKFTVSGYPIYISNEKTNGWNNLVVYSGGKNRLVKFNGKKYPSNPSIQPEFNGTTDSLTAVLNNESLKYTFISL